MNKIQELAKMIDHSILHPILTDVDLKKHCELAAKYHTATVCVKPFQIKLAAQYLKGSDVRVGAAIGFPHGNSTTEIKVLEAEQVIRDGAVEVDVVVNIGKVLQGDWDYVEKELKAVNDTCVKHKAILKVIFENDFVTKDEDKIRLCEICSKLKIAFVKTSSGYGFVKDADGKFYYKGATEHDLKLMRKHCSPETQVKAAGGVNSLDQLLNVKEWGATRSGSFSTEIIMEEAIKRFS